MNHVDGAPSRNKGHRRISLLFRRQLLVIVMAIAALTITNVVLTANLDRQRSDHVQPAVDQTFVDVNSSNPGKRSDQKAFANELFQKETLNSHPSLLVTKTWDGGGATNNWSEAANWSGDTVPVAGDDVVFDATSVKNVTIDTNITVTGWQIGAGYTGTILQGASTVTVNGPFAQTAGIYNGGNGLVHFNSTFAQTGGTFIASSGTTTFSSGFTQTSGIFNHNSGSIIFDGSNNPFALQPTLNLNNVTINVSFQVYFNTNSTIVVGGTLTLTNGLISNNTQPGTINATGNVSIAPTFDGGTSTLLIDGPAVRTVTFPAGAGLPAVRVNSASVTIATSDGPVTFANVFDIQNAAGFTYVDSLTFAQSFVIASSLAMSGSGTVTFNNTFIQTGGTFSTGSPLVDFNSTFTQTGGTFIASSGTTTFSSGFTQTSGIFNHNSGSIIFDGSDNPFTLQPTLNLNNVTINVSFQVYFNSNSTIVVGGALTLINGLISNNTQPGTINATGNVSIAPTFDGGTSTLLIDGPAVRTVTFPVGAGVPKLTVNSSTVSLNTNGSGTVTFANPVDIENTAGFTYSTDLTFSNTFIFGGAAAIMSGGGSITSTNTFTQSGGTITPGGSCTFASFSLSGGTFTGGSALIDFNSNFTQTGGTFIASSGTTTFSSGFTQTSGIFNHNSGSIIFDGSNNPFALQPTLNLNNVTINVSFQVYFNTNSTIVVGGTLTLTNGLISNNTQPGTINATGNVSIAPTFDGGTASMMFSGAANQTYLNTGGVNLTGTWTVNKSGGTVILNDDLNISSGTGNFVLTSGTITTGTKQVITGTRPITRTNGFINGNLQRAVTAVGSRQFDVGTVNGYAPVTLNVTTGTFPITFIAGGNDGTLAGSDPAQSLTRNWTLTPSASMTADITFKYLETDVPVGANEAGLRFLRRSGTTTDQGITTLDTTGNLATLNGVSTFSDWGLGTLPAGPCPPVPINFGNSFAGILDNSSCTVGGDKTDLYSFSGTAGQQIAITMTSDDFFPKIELLDASSNVIAQAGGVSGQGNARLPVSAQFFSLPSAGIYTIRAIAPFGGSGPYILSLFTQQIPGCTYTLSSPQTLVPPVGGSFRFTVLTQPGCPPAAPPATSGTIYSNATYSGGQVSFDVSSNPGAGNRQDTISIGGQTHTIIQYGQAPPTNDNFVDAQLLTGTSGTVIGGNTNATAEPGEPAHAGVPAAHSVWYRWTAPDTGLFSFTTAGSSFDTTLGVYTGSSVSTLTQIAANDDSASFDPTSLVVFHADAGTEYFIAVDGKNNSVGIVNLIYRQAARTYRFYAQTGNGNISPRVPTIIATRDPGGNQYTAVNLSPGLFELDLPVDNAIYQVSITGSDTWNPNSFTIDNTRRPEVRNNATGENIHFEPDSGNLNLVINAVTVAATVTGALVGVTSTDGVTVFLGSEGGPNPIAPIPCAVTMSTTVNYECQLLVDTRHQIKPSLNAIVFAPVNVRFPPLNANLDGVDFIAGNGQTYNISGQVTADGSPLLNATVFLTGHKINSYLTAADGHFEFDNLPAGYSYTVSAALDGYVFTPQTIENLQSNQVLNMAAQGGCTYSVSTNQMAVSADGGEAHLTVSTANGCPWGVTNTASWITVTHGSGNGSGDMYFSVEPNHGMGRSTTMTVAGHEVTVEQANGCTYALSGGTHSFPYTGGSSSIDVTASDAGCQWTPAATDYCMINGLTGGIGNSAVELYCIE